MGQIAGALLATMAASSVIFNTATGLDPANFSYVVAFTALLTADYLLTVGTVLVEAGFLPGLSATPSLGPSDLGQREKGMRIALIPTRSSSEWRASLPWS